MKKMFVVCAFGALFARAAISSVLDPFLPKNEHYVLDSYGIGYAVSFAGSVGSDTSAGIAVNGKVWQDGGYVQKYTFAAWASKCVSYNPGSGITGSGTDHGASWWTDTSKALGQATASDTADVVVLGEGGDITLGFDYYITDGEGYDFAIFENSLNDTFLEFAYVEVSSDGEHFVRFPNFYTGASPVGSDIDDGNNDPTKAYNLGSKYRIGFGCGYDLSELSDAYEYALSHYNPETGEVSASSTFSAEYMKSLLEDFEYLDLDAVSYVRIVDVVGDGSCLDSMGRPIYDAYPTQGTSGFDLSGVGIINAGDAVVPEASSSAFVAAVAALLFCVHRRFRKR